MALMPMHVFGRITSMLTLGLLLSLLAAPVGSEAESSWSRLRVIALAPLDGQAVVQLPRGTLHLVRQGEFIPGTDATVVQVLPDRLVVSHHTAASGEAWAWIYQAPAQGGFSRVMYLHHHASRPERARVSVPTSPAPPTP
jgi:hypothetical protein